MSENGKEKVSVKEIKTAGASMQDVVAAAGIERDARGNYPAKPYRTCLHWAAMFAATDSALRANDREIQRLNAQLMKSAQDNSKLAAENADKERELRKLGAEKIRIGLENNPNVTESERTRLLGSSV